MHTISDNMLVDVALQTQQFQGVLTSKYYDMREFDRIMFLLEFDGFDITTLNGQVAIVMDDTGTGTTNKVLKTFAATPIPGAPKVWAVEVKAEDLDDGLPFVRVDVTNVGPPFNGEKLTVVAALCSPHQTYENKLGADKVFKSWE